TPARDIEQATWGERFVIRGRGFRAFSRSIGELADARRIEHAGERDAIFTREVRGKEDRIGAVTGAVDDLQRRDATKEFQPARFQVHDEVRFPLERVREGIAGAFESDDADVVDPAGSGNPQRQAQLRVGTGSDLERPAAEELAVRFAEDVRLQEQRVYRQSALAGFDDQTISGRRHAKAARLQGANHIRFGDRRAIAEDGVVSQLDPELLSTFNPGGEYGLEVP